MYMYASPLSWVSTYNHWGCFKFSHLGVRLRVSRSEPRKGVFVRVVKVWDWRQFVQVRTYLGFVRCADFLPQVHLVKLSIKV